MRGGREREEEERRPVTTHPPLLLVHSFVAAWRGEEAWGGSALEREENGVGRWGRREEENKRAERMTCGSHTR
jgi:hypothetical protein